MSGSNDENLMTLEQAAVELRVSKSTLRRWINSGYMPCIRVGSRGDRRFKRCDFERFIENQMREQSGGPQSDTEGD